MKRLVCSSCGGLWRKTQRKCKVCGCLISIHAWPSTVFAIRDRFTAAVAAFKATPKRDAASIEERLKDLY